MSSNPVRYREMVSVYRGSLHELLAMRATLACRGIEVFVADENMSMVDPMAISGGVLGSRLMAPRSRAADTVAAIRQIRDGQLRDESRETSSSSATHMNRLARRIQWACLFSITAPIALFLGVRYLARTREGERANRHGMTVAATLLSIPMTALLVVAFTSIATSFVDAFLSAP